jgi:NTE family protein
MLNFPFRKKDSGPKVGLALGSGSARGWAHIGVIQALTEAGIQVDYIAGTSMGALVGAVFASGNIATLKEVALQLDWKQILHFFDVVFPRSGLIDGKKVTDFMRNHVQRKNIEELRLPFSAVSTDLVTGQEVVIKEGDVIEAVRASISIPGIFTPVRKDSMILVDGGLVNPVPVSVVRSMGADFVIAVDLNKGLVGQKGNKKNYDTKLNHREVSKRNKSKLAEKTKIFNALNKKLGTLDLPAINSIKQWLERDPLPSIFEVFLASISIMETQITVTKLKTDPADLLIQPNLGYMKFLELNRAQEAIEVGYQETRAQIGPLLDSSQLELRKKKKRFWLV